MGTKNTATALISVSDKTGLEELADFFSEQHIRLISTGGTAKFLRELGYIVEDVSDVTGFPEMLDGRVKTLHPTIHGGLLGRSDVPEHVSTMKSHKIDRTDYLIVNLYPFEKTLKSGAEFDECLENVDIGGPAMIRSASKNHQDVTVITCPSQYSELIAEITNSGRTSAEFRRKMAYQAFCHTAEYDSMISCWLGQNIGTADNFPQKLTIALNRKENLRYGENPHQTGALYVLDDVVPGVVNAKQIQGKQLSYNNISDADAAWLLVNEFSDPTVVIVKHGNPCGVASAKNISDAFNKALDCDPVSAYGGIIALNRAVDQAFVEAMGKLFVEVIIAPEFNEDALERFKKRENLRLLETGDLLDNSARWLMRSVAGGMLVQTDDQKVYQDSELRVVTKRQPTESEMEDLKFALNVCKHVKSNAIVYARNGATVGIGAGQMSRVDSTRIGAWKARETNRAVEDAKGSVLASDAFFPFADGLEAAAAEGVTAVIQPGGSIRDEEVIKAADDNNIAMIFTGTRHFRH